MDVIESVLNRKERPAYVRFIREAEEDVAASKREGRYVARDIDIACITPPYSKDVMKFKVQDWFDNMANDVRNGRMPSEWAESYREKYHAWKKGEELPLDGVPIKGWQVASPAQQDTLLRMNILTVEDLAQINDEGVRRIGMGAYDLKNKAIAWLQAAKDTGPVVQEIAALKRELETKNGAIESLQRQVNELSSIMKTKLSQPPVYQVEQPELPASVIPVDERSTLEAQYRAKYGRNPHSATTIEKLRERIAE